MQVAERILQEISNKVGNELSVVGSGLCLVGAVNRSLDLGLSTVGGVDVVKELHQQHGLRLETSLVIIVSHNKEDILKNGDEKSLELWEDLTALGRNEWICWVEDAKKPETRRRRIERVAADIKEGKRRPCCWPGCPHRDKNKRL